MNDTADIIQRHRPVHGGWNSGSYTGVTIINFDSDRPMTGWLSCLCGWRVENETRQDAESAHAHHVAEFLPDA